MNHSKIAVRYARALFDTALGHDAVDAIYADMKTIDRLYAIDEVREVVKNPVISDSKRKEIILALTGKDVNPHTVKFIELMFSNGRGDHLGAAARNYIDFTRSHRGIRHVTITTAVPVSGKLKEELAEVIAGHDSGKTEYIENIDSSVIGGFILRVDDSYIDASVRSRLNRYRKEFLLAGYAEE